MISFKDYLKLHIKASGITWKYAANKLNVPYITFFKWTKGIEPPEYVQDLIKEKINSWSIPTE